MVSHPELPVESSCNTGKSFRSSNYENHIPYLPRLPRKDFRQHRLKTNLKFPKKIYCGIFAHLCLFLAFCWGDAVNWKMSYWGESFILLHVEFWSQSNGYHVANSSEFALGRRRSEWTVISEAAWRQSAWVEYLSCLPLSLSSFFFFCISFFNAALWTWKSRRGKIRSQQNNSRV